jgi:DNA repair exonuclease SbcCD nuclease subunit
MKVRRIYTITDLHFGIRNNSLSWKDMMKDFFNWFITDIKSKGFDPKQDILFILGDIFNSRESVNIMILDAVLDIFNMLSSEFPNGVHVIVGNHDAYYIDSNDVTSVSIIDKILSNVNGYYKPKQITIGDNKCLILPWISNYDEIHSILESDDSDYLFCHMDINDMKYSSGINIEKCADRKILNKYKHVFSGHIHIRQTSGNITYFGTPYQLDTGDIGNNKGYHYIDTEDDFKVHFVENIISPKFKVINIYKILNESISDIKELLDNAYVEVLCDSKIYDKVDLLLFRKKLLDLNINYLKMEFTEYKDLEEDSDVELSLDHFSFDVIDSSKGLLKNQKKTDSEIEDIMFYFNDLYKKIKTEQINGAGSTTEQ